MKRAREVKTAGHWDNASAVDTITLDADERHRRRVVLTGERGTKFLLDLPQATALRDGDERFRPADDPHDRAVIQHQPVAVAQRRRLRQIE